MYLKIFPNKILKNLFIFLLWPELLGFFPGLCRLFGKTSVFVSFKNFGIKELEFKVKNKLLFFILQIINSYIQFYMLRTVLNVIVC